MLGPFFSLAMIAPGRQHAFRRAVMAHLLFLSSLGWALQTSTSPKTLLWIGYAILGAGIVEGAVLIGWRLTQIPKSQALEFLLTSPVQPKRVFMAEALVGIARLALVTLSGLPIFGVLLCTGKIELWDILPFLVIPFLWGTVAGLGLTVWAYEPIAVRRLGELLALFGVVVYLVVGVLAGERLRIWLLSLPDEWANTLFHLFLALHFYNPFGVIQTWFDPNRVAWIAWDRMLLLQWIGLGLASLLLVRGMFRLRGHFQDRHYRPITDDRAAETERIGDQPLSWWAVRRVMEYSGRINLWIAGGFALIYSAYILAGDAWPTWMGHMVFQICERMGGAPAFVTGLIVLAAVPAAFQFGLWDASIQDRCRRLELLLLTPLNGKDYWHASLQAAWRRGRGYFFIAFLIWGAMLLGGHLSITQYLASMAASVLLWTFSFVVGFASFSSGLQANGLGSFLTLGFPLLTFAAMRLGYPSLAALVPTGAVYVPLLQMPTWTLLPGPLLVGLGTLWLARKSIQNCDRHLRVWYDANQGKRTE